MKLFCIICTTGTLLFLLLHGTVVDSAAVEIGRPCKNSGDCAVQGKKYPCHGADPDQKKDGACLGPCETKGQCSDLLKIFKPPGIEWKNVACTGTEGKPGVCVEAPLGKIPTGPQSGAALMNLVKALTDWLFAIFLMLAVIFIIIAAFQFLTGGGDPAQVSTARMKLVWAGTAIAGALIARGIPVVVRAIVGS
ncbi:MAG: hypothetical protein AAB567_02070 [Patescibacteria group bacterium]